MKHQWDNAARDPNGDWRQTCRRCGCRLVHAAATTGRRYFYFPTSIETDVRPPPLRTRDPMPKCEGRR